jgi:hypothetical protein
MISTCPPLRAEEGGRQSAPCGRKVWYCKKKKYSCMSWRGGEDTVVVWRTGRMDGESLMIDPRMTGQDTPTGATTEKLQSAGPSRFLAEGQWRKLQRACRSRLTWQRMLSQLRATAITSCRDVRYHLYLIKTDRSFYNSRAGSGL